MSPIVDCGFPPVTAVPNTNPPQVIHGSLLLLQHGPTVGVEIGFDPGLFHSDPATVRAAMEGIHSAPLQQELIAALLDTGATESCVDEELAIRLQLPLIDRGSAAGIDGEQQFNVYLGYIRIASLGFLQYGRFLGVRLKAGGQQHQTLLGRTVLQGMIMVYDGRDGSCRLAV